MSRLSVLNCITALLPANRTVAVSRWDATLQRWVRDKRVSGEVWANVPTMKPKTGERHDCSCRPGAPQSDVVSPRSASMSAGSDFR